MPYLENQLKTKYYNLIEPVLDEIRNETIENRAGIFNYIITAIAITITRKKYWCIALTMGTIICATFEFYRRFVAPHEDKKIKENGDIY